MAAQIRNSGCYTFGHIYEQVKETALQMLRDGHLTADNDFLSAQAIRIIDKHDGNITVDAVLQELNSIFPGCRVEWRHIVMEIPLGPYTVIEDEDRKSDERVKIVKSHEYHSYRK